MRHHLCWNLMGTLLLIWGISIVAMGQAQPIHITDGPRVEGISEHTAVIAWTTNTRGSSIVHYGTNPNSLNQTAASPYTQQGQTHRVQIKNLQPNATYYFKVDSGQGYGTGTDSESQVGQFQTKALGPTPALWGRVMKLARKRRT